MLAGFGRLFAECLAQAVPEFRVIEASGESADVVVINVTALDSIHDLAPRARVIAYGVEPEAVPQWIEAGASAYLPRDASLAELKRTVQLVLRDQMPVGPEIVSALSTLTLREIHVLRCIAEGLPNRDIAKRMSVSSQTVKNYVGKLFRKIGVRRRSEAVEYARQQGWIEPAASRVRGLARELAGEAEPPLTPRELEVLGLAARGLSNPQIARELRISPQTVKSHLHSIYTSLGVRTRHAAVANALRLGMLRFTSLRSATPSGGTP